MKNPPPTRDPSRSLRPIRATGIYARKLEFVSDSQGRRISKTVSTSNNGSTWIFLSNQRFLYDGWNLIAEYSAPTATSTSLTLQATHTWGIDLSGSPQGAGGVGGLLSSTLLTTNPITSNSYFPAYDGNGNISAWIDGTGTLLARMDYSPFGQLIAQYKFTPAGSTTLSRLPFGFSTKYTDSESGLLYYGYRYYDSVSSRWQSRDPIEESGGINIYGFTQNNPLLQVDYLGLSINTQEDESYRSEVKNSLEKYTGATLSWEKSDSQVKVHNGGGGDWYKLCAKKPGNGRWWKDLVVGIDDDNFRYLTKLDFNTGKEVINNAGGASKGGSRRVEISPKIRVKVPLASGQLNNNAVWKEQEQGFDVNLWHELVAHSILELKHPRNKDNSFVVISLKEKQKIDQRIEAGKKVKDSFKWVIHFNRIGEPDPTLKYMNEFSREFKFTVRRPTYWDYWDESSRKAASNEASLPKPEDLPSK